MSLSRILIGLLIVGVVCFVISEPSSAGATAAHAVLTVFGWGKGLANACVSFVNHLV